MAVTINQQLLERLSSIPSIDLEPEKAYQLATHLRKFAPCILSADTIEKAKRHLSMIFGESGWSFAPRNLAAGDRLPRGMCLIVMANRSYVPGSCLAPGFVLPVRWVEASDHHPALPAGLRHLADKVIDQVYDYVYNQTGKSTKTSDAEEVRRYRLRPEPVDLLEGVDIAQADFSFDSAWTSLAAGLLLVYLRAIPRADTLATGADGDGTIDRVDYVEAKLWVANQFGARLLFVPDGQLDEFRQAAARLGLNNTEVRGFQFEQGSLGQLLKNYLRELQVPPGPDDPQEDHARYYSRHPDNDEARRHYRRYILPKVVENLRLELLRRGIKATHVVLTLSDSPQLAELALRAIQPQKALIFHDGQREKVLADLRESLEKADISTCIFDIVFPQQPDWEKYCQCYSQGIREFLEGVSPDQVIVELQGGKKIMSLACYEAAPPGAWVLLIDSEFDSTTRRPKPFSEKFHFIREGKSR